jgi:hypothetical protein
MKSRGPVLTLALAASCSPSEAPAEESRYVFVDATASSGLAAFQQVNGGPEKLFVLESFGAGVALFDAENDGDLDAYLTNATRLEGPEASVPAHDALFLNDGAGQFSDGTRAAGLGDASWTCGVRTVDLDADGDSELYLTNYGPNVLYDNTGGGRFVDVTARAGVGDPGWSTGSAFLDMDKDGDLDLYVANYLEFEREAMLRDRPRGTMNGHSQKTSNGKALDEIAVMKGPMGLPPSQDRFYRNQGDGVFRDESEAVGISGEKHFSFQVLTFDQDEDGWLDVMVVNDVVEDLLWHNDKGERFLEHSLRAGVAVRKDGVPQGGMGGAVGDYDGDLLPDLWVTNYVEDYSTLFRGGKGGFFSDVTLRTGLSDATWSMVGWGCGFVDFDSDGDLELFEVNGHVYPQVDLLNLGTTYRQKNQLWEFADGKFVAVEAGEVFHRPRAGRGAAVGDVDGDGDMDVLFGNLDEAPTLCRNESRNGQWLKVELRGAHGNRGAIGARLVLSVGAKKHLRLVGAGSSFLSSNDPREHFGLGAAREADELLVKWPDGRQESFRGLAAGKLHVVTDSGSDSPSTLASVEL